MEPGDWIALVVGATAVAVACWTAWATIKHNKLSVRPLLQFETDIRQSPHKVDLVNVGVGPAIIRICKDSYNQRPEASLSEADFRRRANFTKIPPGTAIPAGTRHTLVEVEAFGEPPGSGRLVYGFHCRIEYESIYGEQQPVAEH